MNFTHILGIDISKKTFDVALTINAAKQEAEKACFNNNLKGFKELRKWLAQYQVEVKTILVCMENTGIYHRCLAAYLNSIQSYVWVQTPVEIKWSMGIQRGKSDPVDAARICLYAYRNQDKARAYSQVDKSLQKVADLLSTRERLIQAKKMLFVPINELKDMGLKEEAKVIEKSCIKSITALDKEKEAIDIQLEQIIEQQQDLKENYKYVKSVRCVGLLAALQFMVYTNNFQKFDNAKQIASYAGVAPFEYSSGTSVRGKTKVSKMANKTLKTTLHMCAVSSVRHNPEMREFMAKKVGEGKNKMSILNAIRNKIIQRVFACVRDKKLYELNK